MVNTRTTNFHSPLTNKNNKKQTTKYQKKTKSKHKYDNTPKKTSRITDHLISKKLIRNQSTKIPPQKKDKIHLTTNYDSDNSKSSKPSSTNNTTTNLQNNETQVNSITNNNDYRSKTRKLTNTNDETIVRESKTDTKLVTETMSDNENNHTNLKTCFKNNTKKDDKKNATNEKRKIMLEQINLTKRSEADRHSRTEVIKEIAEKVEKVTTSGNTGYKESNTKENKRSLDKDKNRDEEIQERVKGRSNSPERKITKDNAKTPVISNDRTNKSIITRKEEEEEKSQNKTSEHTKKSDKLESTEKEVNDNSAQEISNDPKEKNEEEENQKNYSSNANPTSQDDLVLDSLENDLEKELSEHEYDKFLQDNCQDGESIASKQTLRNHNMNINNEVRSDNSYRSYSSESEDDVNTIDSSKSTQYNNPPSDKEIPPKCIRYQLGINIQPTDIEAIQQAFKDTNAEQPNVTDTLTKIRDHLKELVTEIKKFDRKARIITWKDKETYEFLVGTAEELPNTAGGLGQFFNGIRLRRQQGRQYLRFRLHASKNENILENQITEWARLSGHSFYRCVIQEEHSTPIGWLLYSSQYTNTYHLSNYLQVATGFEWGFRLGSITKSDENIEGKPVSWKDRQKALIVHVPTHKAEVAITKISTLLQAKPIDKKQTPQFFQRYLFVQQEHTMVDVNSRLQYKHILNRQRAHTDSIKSKFILSIDDHIDNRIDTKEGGNLSLREMLLGIKTRQVGDAWDPLPLFHSIDFCADSSKVWIGNSMGPGGPGHIITYYNIVEAEALQMIRGLGVFLGKLYGYENVVQCFNKDHWQSLEGWAFSMKKWAFITPESRQMSDNLFLDPNKMMVRLAQTHVSKTSVKLENKESKQDGKEKLTSINKTVETTEEDSKSAELQDEDEKTATSEIRRAFRINEMKLIQKVQDPDLDSLDNDIDEYKLQQPNDIILNDSASLASSITTNTNEEHTTSSPTQPIPPIEETQGSASTVSSLASITSSIHSITKDKLESLFEVGMTQQERRQRADQYTYQQIRKVMIEKNKIYDSLFPESKEEKEETNIDTPLLQTLNSDHNTNKVKTKAPSLDKVISPPHAPKTNVKNYPKYDKEEISKKPDDDPSNITTQNTGKFKGKICFETVSDESADEMR
jgi:hypothetical protein